MSNCPSCLTFGKFIHKEKTMFSKKIDSFIQLLFVVVLLAYFFPDGAGEATITYLDGIAKVGIFFIFFFYGLKLNIQEVWAGISNWRVHLVVQLATFLLFPLLVLGVQPFFYAANQEVIWLGFFFLAVLPSTVSSSVVMVSMARGNVPAAIFNASISGFIGMLVTPAWMSPFASTVGMKSEMTTIYLNLFLEVLLPVILGLFLNPWGGTWARKQAKKLALMDKATILLIVYKSFAASFLLGIFSSVSWQVMSILCVIVFLFFFLVYGLLTFLARKLQFTLEESIVVVFCGSKKSLVHGTVFSKILFAGSPQLGIILLPLMMYHALQLVFISQIAGKLARRK